MSDYGIRTQRPSFVQVADLILSLVYGGFAIAVMFGLYHPDPRFAAFAAFMGTSVAFLVKSRES